MNEITLTQPLKFGRCKGEVPLDLIKTNKGLNYLAWVFNNTDIPIDCHVVNTLVSNNLVILNKVRKNSREAYPQVTIIDGGNLSKHVTQEQFQKGIARARDILSLYEGGIPKFECKEPFIWKTKNILNDNYDLQLEIRNRIIADQISQCIGQQVRPSDVKGLIGRHLMVKFINND